MKYTGMPFGMWMLFNKSFRKQLNSVLNMIRKLQKQLCVKQNQNIRK